MWWLQLLAVAALGVGFRFLAVAALGVGFRFLTVAALGVGFRSLTVAAREVFSLVWRRWPCRDAL
jgi:hypothetical protein